MKVCRLSLIAALLQVWGVGAAVAQVQATATVDNSRPTVGDTITYTFQVSANSQLGSVTPSFPPFTGFQVGQMMGPMQSTQIVNFRVSSSVSWSVEVTVAREGTFTIPPAKATVDGRMYESNPVAITVGKDAQSNVPQTVANEDILSARIQGNPTATEQLKGRLFVRPAVSKANPYVREEIVVSYYLYMTPEVQRIFVNCRYTPFDNSSNSFLVEPQYEAYDHPFEPKPVTLDGRQYVCALLSQVVVFPTAPGKTQLPPFQATVDLRTESRKRARDPFGSQFGDLFDDPFGVFRSNTVAAVVPARQIELDARPLPQEGRPANFQGAVGDYKIAASLSRNEVKEYDLVNLRVVVEGNGAIASVPDPDLGKIEGVEVYESKAQVEKGVRNGEFGGKKTFEVALQPTRPGDRTIPPLSYSFFNPRIERYETVQTAALPLKVEVDPKRSQGLVVVAASQKGAAPGASAPEVRVLSTGIRTIKTGSPLSVFREQPLYRNAAFWAVQLVPLAFWAAGLWFGARRRRLETDEAFARSVGAKERASRRLKGAAQSLKRKDMETFYLEVATALRGLVADRCSLATAGATNEELRDAVLAKTGSQELSGRLFSLLGVCDAARYASGAGMDASAQRWEEAKRLTRELERQLRIRS